MHEAKKDNDFSSLHIHTSRCLLKTAENEETAEWRSCVCIFNFHWNCVYLDIILFPIDGRNVSTVGHTHPFAWTDTRGFQLNRRRPWWHQTRMKKTHVNWLRQASQWYLPHLLWAQSTRLEAKMISFLLKRDKKRKKLLIYFSWLFISEVFCSSPSQAQELIVLIEWVRETSFHVLKHVRNFILRHHKTVFIRRAGIKTNQLRKCLVFLHTHQKKHQRSATITVSWKKIAQNRT